MFVHCELLILIVVLTLHGQVHTGEIIGGQEAVAHSRPYMVLLEQRLQNGKWSHCGGFLLNEDFVMTAAHCNANYTVLLGLHKANNRTDIQNISVENKYPHEDYDGVDYKSDIMLLKLSSKAKFSKDVKPIALADKGDGSLPKNCSVSGWGRSVKNKTLMSIVLMEVNVTLVDSEQCAQDNLYCSKGESGPRKGDSGGPLVCEDGKAYGVVSALTPNPNAPERYTYTKIPDYKSWIDSIMKPKRKLWYI